MTSDADARDQVLEAVRAASVELVHLQFTDVPGAIKNMTIPASRLDRAFDHGVWFDGSSIEGLTRVVERDLYLRPDPTTFTIVPWESRPTARLICDVVVPDGTVFRADPRAVLKAYLENVSEAGFSYRVACEVEFFVFDARASTHVQPVDRSSYFEIHGSRAMTLCSAVVDVLGSSFGVPVDATHHEVGPGQYEIDLAEQDALRAADGLVALKWALRALAHRYDMRVSFMPKPLESASGSGLHVAQVLMDSRGNNAFLDAGQPYALSTLASHFIAGQLTHARGMSAIIAPLVNSYKRLAGGAEAPSRITWARLNRGAYLRVPEAPDGQTSRLELRAPDPSCNPYLALTAMLRAGMDGIDRQLTVPDPLEQFAGYGDTPNDDVAEQLASPLPATLGEALEELEWDQVVREALGQAVIDVFLAAKESEWLSYTLHISQWERDRYLDSA
jgi:glutamine synthetase